MLLLWALADRLTPTQRAWLGEEDPALRGELAHVRAQFAGTIHSDIERGFIRAEVVHCDDLIRLKTLAACKDAGLLRLEGKEYVMQDGDVAHFRFNV